MKRWYLVYCKRGEQPRAQRHLHNQNVECYYPTVTLEKKVRGKIKKVEEPLFPSYMFVRFDYIKGPSFTTIRSTRGITDFIRFGAYPKELQGDLIYYLKQLEQEKRNTENEEQGEAKPLVKGTMVNILQGQFTGMEAIYLQPDGDMRSIMLVEMLNKMVPISVDNQNLER